MTELHTTQYINSNVALSAIEDAKVHIAKFMAERPASNTATTLAERFLCAKRIYDELDAIKKTVSTMLEALKLHEIPQAFEREKATSVTLNIGYRVTLSQLTRAQMIDPEAGKQWLRDNDHEYVITETVNAQTLASLAKELMEQGVELPDDKFKVTLLPSVSVTKVRR